jgi:uncharacterized coiled-coil protein SlyX
LEESVDKVIEIVRLEERVKTLTDKVSDLEDQYDKLNDKLTTDIKEIEEIIGEFQSRINNLEYLSSKQSDRWQTITKYLIQTAWIILLAWTLAKLNLSAPPFN